MWIGKYIKKYWGLFFILLVSFFAVKPLFVAGFFPMHDDTQVARVFEMGKALHDGMFPVRWVTDLGYGYGYPIFNFYAPLAYYLGGIFILFGANALLSTKIIMMLGILLAGVSMYFFARNFWGEIGGSVSGLYYVYATYHATDIYVRGDVAEFWAYAFIPFVFLGLYKVFSSLNHNPTSSEMKKGMANHKGILSGILLGAVGYAGVILSHNLTAFMLTLFLIPLTVAIIFISKKKRQVTSYILLTTVLGLLLSAFYWLPVPFEMKYTNVLSQIGGKADFRQHFVCPSQFWYSPWGYGGSVAGCIDGLSFMLGKLYIVFPLLSIVGIFVFWKKRKTYALAILIAFLGWVLSLFLTTASSQFLWENFSAMAFFQYPWRFLLFSAFFSSFLIGSLIAVFHYFIKKKILVMLLGCIMITAVIFFQAKLFVPQKALSVTSDYYTSQKALRWTASKISDEYLPKNFLKPHSSSEIASKTFSLDPKEGSILSEREETQEKTAVLQSFSFSQNTLGLAYFPTWQYYVDTKQEKIENVSGKITVTLPKGQHSITVSFQQSPIETIANILSLTGFLCCILGIIYSIISKKKEMTIRYEKTNS